MQFLVGRWPRALRHSGKVCLGEPIRAEEEKSIWPGQGERRWGESKYLLGSYHSASFRGNSLPREAEDATGIDVTRETRKGVDVRPRDRRGGGCCPWHSQPPAHSPAGVRRSLG